MCRGRLINCWEDRGAAGRCRRRAWEGNAEQYIEGLRVTWKRTSIARYVVLVGTDVIAEPHGGQSAYKRDLRMRPLGASAPLGS